jgi:nucleoside-diphosphate-sugar epimerase
MVAAIEGNYNGTFNVGSGKGISTTEVAQIVVKILGSNSIIKHQEINDFAPNVIMDSNLAKITFGWQPKINSDEGISKVVDKFIKCFQYNNT